MEGTLTRSLTNLPLARIEWRATFSQANSHTHTHLLSLSLLSLSLTQGEEGTPIHSPAALTHRVEGTLTLTSRSHTEWRVHSFSPPNLNAEWRAHLLQLPPSLTHTMEELSLSLSHTLTLSHP